MKFLANYLDCSISTCYRYFNGTIKLNINKLLLLKELYNVLEKKTYTTITWSEYGDYIDKYNKYADELINISNGIITYNLIKAYETGEETYMIEK